MRDEKAYVSGSALARRLGVSRPAIWKQMQVLREEGYDIEARRRLGYHLRSAPDRVCPDDLPGTSVMGGRILCFDAVDSTNNKVKELAQEGAPEGTVVVAERQGAGRGRRGRGWFSPPGGIYFSVLLRPRLTPEDLPRVTLMSAVAVARALRDATGLDVKIKWPNDLLLEGRKLAGILTEMSAEADSIGFLVVGVGVNANVDRSAYPPDLQEGVASLAASLGRPVERSLLLVSMLEAFDRLYRELLDGGFASILEEWKNLSSTLGSSVCVSTVEGCYEGTAVEVEPDGALLVRGGDGSERLFHSGQVEHLKPA